LKKVLVIDEDEALRSNILDLLEAEAFDGIGAADGREGIEAALCHLPHAIICDVRMREMHGHDVFKRMRAEPSLATVPFLFLSASAEQADIRAGLTLGANDYLTKPFTCKELLDALALLLRP
jgi:DNA-binding response OmpR family regulator